MRERDISRLLAEREGGECEVRTPAGNIDVLTAKYVYEVKVARQWKAALGQVLAYTRTYPDRKPRLYLFGETGGMTKAAIAEHCRAAGVGVVWHRDEDVPPPAPRKQPAPLEDGISLQLTAVDTMYGIRSVCTFRLPTPTEPVSSERLGAYADEALAVFDALLDNGLTLKLTTTFGGERQVVERVRQPMNGYPVCYQLKLTLRTSVTRPTFTASLPGVRKQPFALAGRPDAVYSTNHALRRIPELQRLEALICHPEFPWLSAFGEPATGIERAIYRNYGIKRGKDGPRIGGR